MADMVITIAAAVFLAGIVMGVIIIVCVGIRQEERDFVRTGLVSMTRRAPGLFSGGARSLMGLYVGQRTDLEPAAVRYRDRADLTPIGPGPAGNGDSPAGPAGGRVRAAPSLGHGAAAGTAVGAIEAEHRV